MLAASSGPFGCSLKELRELMELRGHDACERIRKEYGTVEEICRRLHTSSTDGQFDFVAGVMPRNLKIEAVLLLRVLYCYTSLRPKSNGQMTGQSHVCHV
jgi:hypothetical protein